jgi:hypothetical protein
METMNCICVPGAWQISPIDHLVPGLVDPRRIHEQDGWVWFISFLNPLLFLHSAVVLFLVSFGASDFPLLPLGVCVTVLLCMPDPLVYSRECCSVPQRRWSDTQTGILDISPNAASGQCRCSLLITSQTSAQFNQSVAASLLNQTQLLHELNSY